MSDKHMLATEPTKRTLLQRFSLFFFKRAGVSVFLWLTILVFGILSYTVFLQRQGFPGVEVPFSMVNGTYLVNDAEKVDRDLATPMTTAIKQIPDVKKVTAKSDKNFINLAIEFKDGVTSQAGSEKVEAAAKKLNLPPAASLQFKSVNATQFNNAYDLIVSVYGDPGLSTQALEQKAQSVAADLKTASGVVTADVIGQFRTATDPATGKPITEQHRFDRIAVRDAGELQFHNSVSIGLTSAKDTDALKLYDAVQQELAASTGNGSTNAVITANYAEGIREQVNGLQTNLSEGLIIVVIVSFLLISWRAGLATALGMVTVLVATIGALKLFGYTLNTITLFALILSLGLIVDDTTIVGEAIDAEQSEKKTRRETVALAVKRVARASVAGTLVTILTFAPMLFIGGVLGGFIRALPITIITSLALSLIVSLSLIPFLSRYLILGKKVRSKSQSRNPILRAEHAVSSSLARMIIWTKGRGWRQVGISFLAFALSVAFLVGSFGYFSKLKFDIFPSPKDSDALAMSLRFDTNTTLAQAEEVTDRANDLAKQTLGENLRRSEYLNSGTASDAQAQLDLVPFKERSTPAPQLQKQLETAFTGFKGAEVKFSSLSAGPPKDDAPFRAQITTEDPVKATALAKDMVQYMDGREITRANGTTAHLIKPRVAAEGFVVRNDGVRIFEVQASFDAEDVSALVTAAKTNVQGTYNEAKLASYGLKTENLKFDFGSEEENQDSFKSMMMAFPVLLLAMFILLVVLFRSLLQPLLIFMAIPFSFLGVAAGLYYSDNALSFFVMIGFFALMGIAINNTIMLVDYANQALRSGMTHTEAMAEAVRHRFRPLLATSLTSVVALLPLALSDPFWEALALTLICGLLSSTFLVIIAFPYYWLAAEWVRLKTKRGFRRLFRRGKAK